MITDQPTDILITNHGSVVQFWPLTPAATTWIDDNVELESWQWLGGASFNVDWRYADPLIEGMAADGLRVEVSHLGMGD